MTYKSRWSYYNAKSIVLLKVFTVQAPTRCITDTLPINGTYSFPYDSLYFFQAMAISNSLGHKGSQTQFYHCEVCEYVFPTFPFLNPSIEGWVYNIAKICPSFKPIRYIIHFKIRSSNIRNNYKKKSPGVDYESYF